jgi:chemotaxis protein CheZ
LQSLFDSVVARAKRTAAGSAESPGLRGEQWQGQDRVFQRIGQMARQLHDTLGQLGYHKLIEKHGRRHP